MSRSRLLAPAASSRFAGRVGGLTTLFEFRLVEGERRRKERGRKKRERKERKRKERKRKERRRGKERR